MEFRVSERNKTYEFTILQNSKIMKEFHTRLVINFLIIIVRLYYFIYQLYSQLNNSISIRSTPNALFITKHYTGYTITQLTY